MVRLAGFRYVAAASPTSLRVTASIRDASDGTFDLQRLGRDIGGGLGGYQARGAPHGLTTVAENRDAGVDAAPCRRGKEGIAVGTGIANWFGSENGCGGKGMIGVEYLTNLGQVPDGAYFLAAAVKIRGGHGGPGRAIALW